MKLSDYIETLKGNCVAVIGAGVSNMPLIRLLIENDIDLTVCDRRDEKALKENGIEFPRNVKLQLGEDYLEDLYQEIIFRTPGLMPFEEHLVKARERGSLITSEMEVFFSVCPCRTVAITGSDGKTTTSTLIALLLKEAGYKVHLGGNIGNPLLCEADSFGKDDFAVLELSSFQLHSMKCSPDVAVITNISPNHLDKHKDYQDYIDAKKNIFLNQKKDSLLILNKNDEISSHFDALAPSKVRWFSISDKLDNGFYLDGDDIIGNIDGKTEFIM
jgi:UDP-N-acetylmuramoylalanine--D-glutamate ligase